MLQQVPASSLASPFAPPNCFDVLLHLPFLQKEIEYVREAVEVTRQPLISSLCSCADLFPSRAMPLPLVPIHTPRGEMGTASDATCCSPPSFHLKLSDEDDQRVKAYIQDAITSFRHSSSKVSNLQQRNREGQKGRRRLRLHFAHRNPTRRRGFGSLGP